jgi:hypothetical protein
MLKQIEIQKVLNEIGERLNDIFKDNIQNKQIERKRVNGSTFKSEVNASGALKNSGEYRVVDGNTIELWANDYLKYLVYGRPPTQNDGSGELRPAIERWMQSKGINGSSYAISKSIHEHGTSIWRKWLGKDSGLLDEIFDPKTQEEYLNKINQYISLQIENELSQYAKL